MTMREIATPNMDILLFAEDPGACNYLVHLLRIFGDKGFSCILVADGPAVTFLPSNTSPRVLASDLGAADDILKAYEPRMVLVGTSENTESLGLFLVKQAKKRGTPTVGVVDALMNAAYRFRGKTDNPTAFAPDWLIVPDSWTKDEYVRLGYPAEKVAACGHPQYDFVRDKALEMSQDGKDRLRAQYFSNVPSDTILAVFVAEQAGGLNPKQYELSQQYTLFGRGESATRNEIVLEEFLDAMALQRKKPYLVLRLPPKSGSNGFEKYLNEFDQISHREPILEIVYAADCIFGMTTTVLLEAAIIGRPTFSILPRKEERGWLVTICSGLTHCATTRKELHEYLPHFLYNVSSTPQDAGRHFLFGASGRAVSLVESILGP